MMLPKAAIYHAKIISGIDNEKQSINLLHFISVCHHSDFNVRKQFFQHLFTTITHRKVSFCMTTLFFLCAVDPSKDLKEIAKEFMARIIQLSKENKMRVDMLLEHLIVLLSQHPELLALQQGQKEEDSLEASTTLIQKLQTFELFLYFFISQIVTQDNVSVLFEVAGTLKRYKYTTADDNYVALLTAAFIYFHSSACT